MNRDPIEQFTRLVELGEADVFDDLDRMAQMRRSKPAVTEKRPRPALSRLYMRISWNELAAGMAVLSMDRCCRLWLLLDWQARVERPKGGWVIPRAYMLEKIGLRGKHYSEVVSRLERLGVVEVERRVGKKALLRLTRRDRP